MLLAGARRVLIKARVHRMSGSGGGAQRAHISYLERDGAGKDLEPAEFYDDINDGLDGQDWLRDHADDRHHFRFIVSPEDGEKLQDLKPFVRDLVSQMEIDLETKLDWVAVDHYNTEHPHTHIVMSGKRDDGRDLVIPKEYLSYGMRERGSALLTRDLGLQSAQELSAKLNSETGLRKVTRLDRMLMREMQRSGAIDLSNVQHNRPHYRARLSTLRDLGLSEHKNGPVWAIDEKLGPALSALEKSDRVATRIDRAVQSAGLERLSAHEQGEFVFDQSVYGRLLNTGYDDELMDRRYAIVDGLDGRVHHFDLGTSFTKDLRPGDMIEIKARSPGALQMDQTIADIAAKNDELYDRAVHKRIDPKVSDAHLKMIERRLEGLERAGLVERFSSGTVSIQKGFVDHVDKHFEKAAKRSPVIIRKLERRVFEDQVRDFGETWLDQQLAGMAPEPLSEAGLGGDVHAAMTKRMDVHFERGLISGRDKRALTNTQLQQLQHQGMQHAAQKVTEKSGLTYRALQPGEKLEGSFSQVHKTPHAKFAVIERGHEFSLVPWKQSLERLRNHNIQISVSRSMNITWARGRSRGLGR